jgi:hypothetical protein
MWQHLKSPRAYETALSEYEELEYRTKPADLETLGVFPPVPLAVLVHDPAAMIDTFVRAGLARSDAEQVERLWGMLLRDHAAVSPLSNVESVVGSGHLIHLERPMVALDAISRLAHTPPARRGSHL